MTKKKKIVIISCVFACALIVGIGSSILIYNVQHPLTLTYDFDPAIVVRIEIFDGTKGKHYTIMDVPDVTHIATDIKGKTYKRDNNVKGHDGFCYTTAFYDENGNTVWSGTINGADTLADYHYVYHPDLPLDFAYIERLIEQDRYVTIK